MRPAGIESATFRFEVINRKYQPLADFHPLAIHYYIFKES